MKMLRRARLAVAVLALGGLGLGSTAQADPIVGRLIGSVAAGMLVNGAIKKHDRKFAAQCRLYDREGMEVYLPCDSRRPLGEVMLAQRPDVPADGLAGGPPAPIDVAPLAAPAHAPPPMDHYAQSPVRHPAPVETDCGCEPGMRGAPGHAARSQDTYLSARGGHARPSYGSGRAVGVYDAYEEFSESGGVRYSESYSRDGGYGFSGDWGSGGYYPYGGVGYGAGGYGYDRARVAGRDRDGFLTWAGKPVR